MFRDLLAEIVSEASCRNAHKYNDSQEHIWRGIEGAMEGDMSSRQ